MEISTENLATEAGAMALELRIKDRLIAQQAAEIEELRAQLAAEGGAAS